MIGLGENFAAIQNQIELVRKKTLQYTVFKFQENNTTKYEIKESTEYPEKTNVSTVSEEELRNKFEQYRERVKKYGCCYSIFDFETRLDDGAYRSMLVLISVIPDGSSTREERFLYASHSNTIINGVNVSLKLVQINSYDDLTYDALRRMCVALKKH